jgi:Lrp/AsnC family transcriptional regulator, leucine-responsive regulatory protein
MEDGAADEVRVGWDLASDAGIVPLTDRSLHGQSKALRFQNDMKNGLSRNSDDDLPRIDDVDRKIIGELLADGRVSLAELGRRVALSSPAVAERVARLERGRVITGYRAEVDPRALGYELTAIVRIKPIAGMLSRIPELATDIPQVVECHRITGEDCFYLVVLLHSIDELSGLLDRFLVYGQTTTSIVNGTPIPRRDPPIGAGA